MHWARMGNPRVGFLATLSHKHRLFSHSSLALILVFHRVWTITTLSSQPLLRFMNFTTLLHSRLAHDDSKTIHDFMDGYDVRTMDSVISSSCRIWDSIHFHPCLSSPASQDRIVKGRRQDRRRREKTMLALCKDLAAQV